MHWANTNQNEFDDITFPSIIDRLKIVMEPPPNRPKEAVLEVLDNEKTQEQIKTVFRSFFPEDELTGKAAVLTSTTAPPTATTSATPFVPDGMANYEDATNEARKVDGAGGQAEQAALEAETNAAEKAAAKGKAAASSSA
ncbi:unnamed protein product [Amoebophrya sp. A120]|nr:unnamed protein product [Amoebophrya sp. A120]|eukprot:GSA120T00006148001.1